MAVVAVIIFLIALALIGTAGLGAWAVLLVIPGAMYVANVYLGGSLLDPGWDVFWRLKDLNR